MARNQEKQTGALGSLRRAAEAVKRLFARETRAAAATTAAPESQQQNVERSATAPRVTRRETDIPLDVLNRTYTPPFTGAKASFRSDGSDHQNDQEFAYGVADERWNDEDRLTNKSGDPRIGTHRRTYEPGEARSEK